MDANNVASVLSQHTEALKVSGAIPLYLLFWSQFRGLQIDTDKYNEEVNRLPLSEAHRKTLVIRKTRLYDAFRDATARLSANRPGAEVKYQVAENTLAHEDIQGIAVRLMTRIERHTDTKLNTATNVARFCFRADLKPPVIETEILDALDGYAATSIELVHTLFLEEQGRADSDKFGRRVRHVLDTLQGVTVDPGQVMRACKVSPENREVLSTLSGFVDWVDRSFSTGSGRMSACKVGFADLAAFPTVLKLVSDGAAGDFADRIGELGSAIEAIKTDLQLGRLTDDKALERRQEEIRKMRVELKQRAETYREELVFADVKVGLNEERIEDAWQDFITARTNLSTANQIRLKAA